MKENRYGHHTVSRLTAHLIWATMHGLVTIELMHARWGGPLVAHLQGDPEQRYATAIGSLLEALHGRYGRARDESD